MSFPDNQNFRDERQDPLPDIRINEFDSDPAHSQSGEEFQALPSLRQLQFHPMSPNLSERRPETHSDAQSDHFLDFHSFRASGFSVFDLDHLNKKLSENYERVYGIPFRNTFYQEPQNLLSPSPTQNIQVEERSEVIIENQNTETSAQEEQITMSKLEETELIDELPLHYLTLRENSLGAPDSSDMKACYFLFANPSSFFYKKMSNERHYYISQITNGSTGIFLQKPGWKLSKSRLDINLIKEEIYSKTKRMMNFIYTNQISLEIINNKTIKNAFEITDSYSTFPLSEDIEEEIKTSQESFEDYLSKNIYGKKKHSYKVPNADELQKSITITTNSFNKENVERIFQKLCLRVLFEEFFNNKQLYDALVDKITEHVYVEVDKKKKDTNEKLPELKKIFYKTNRTEFGQKFLDPPSQLKGLKINFNYTIPKEEVEDLACDFWNMIDRIRTHESGSSNSSEKPQSLFFSDIQNDSQVKKDNLWIVIPFQKKADFEVSQNILTKRTIKSVSGECYSEYKDFNGSSIEATSIEEDDEVIIKMRGEKKIIRMRNKTPEKKKLSKNAQKILLKSTSSLIRRFQDFEQK